MAGPVIELSRIKTVSSVSLLALLLAWESWPKLSGDEVLVADMVERKHVFRRQERPASIMK
jgi:hypothetical protein